MSKTSYHLRRMSDRLWMLLLVTVVTISIAIVLQDRDRIQSLEEDKTASFEQKDNLAIETSQLKQQVTQTEEQMAKIKQQHQLETARVSSRCSEKLVALEEKIEELEEERIVCDDERDRLLICEKNLMQQHDDCRSQLTATDSATNEEKTRRLETESDTEELRTELLICNAKTTMLEVLLGLDVDKLKTEEVPKTVTGKSGYAASPELVKRLKTKVELKKKQYFTGVAILNEDIFAVTVDSNVIERFDSATLSAKESLLFEDHRRLQHLQACNQNQILFIVDKRSTDDTFISSVDPFSRQILNTWPVDSCIIRISVTEDCHVIAACPDSNSIIEYSSTGHFMREIILKPKIMRPRLALKMTNGNYLVTHDGALGKKSAGLAILNSNGDVLKSTLESARSGESVYGMAIDIDRQGNILVASVRGRVLLFSSDLEYEGDVMASQSIVGVITAMGLDEVAGRLFVGDCYYNRQGDYLENARVLVFDLF